MNNNLPVRQNVAFPTVAKIRKGTPKKKITKGDREIEVMGADLKNRFRFEFLPGTQEIQDAFHAVHADQFVKYPQNFVTPSGYELTHIQAMIPTRTVWDGWRWYNETYNAAGMLVARADRDHYLIKKNPLTMEYIVKDGEPFTPFNVRDAIPYTRGDKEYYLPMKSSGTLKLLLPYLKKFVSFELKTSSYIDSLLIDQQLAAVQAVADVVNNGIAGGIPLEIYRVEMDSPWHTGETSRKGKQWFIQIRINDELAQAAIPRMAQFALTGGGSADLLQPVDLTIPADLPESAFVDTDSESEDGAVTVQAEDVTPDDEQVQPLVYESRVPPRKVMNEIITQAAWDNLQRWVKKAGEAGIKLPLYVRAKMTASTVNGAAMYIQTELDKRGAK